MSTNHDKTSIMEHILVHYRWVFVIFFLLPASFFYDIYSYARSWIVFKLNSAPGNHTNKVKNIQEQVRKWNEGPQITHMCTGRPGWQTISFRRPIYKDTFTKIYINMIDILEVDTKRKIVRCEPLVTMGQLSKVLIGLGWTLPVVPEMDDLTVGGLVMGTGIEASSHKWGLFQHICMSYEIVLSDGEVITCSKEEHKAIFYSIPWSYGTLGFLTSVELKIVPAQKFMRLSYKPCKSRKDFENTFREEVEKTSDNDFVEGLLLRADAGVVMTGVMVSSAEAHKVNSIGKWYKQWFFKHVETKLNDMDSSIEYVPLRDYFHRHTRSIFWEIKDIIPFGNHTLFRYLLGWMSPPKVSLLKVTQTDAIKKLYEKYHFIQDILVPLTYLSSAFDCLHQEVEIYPLWVCPFKLETNPGMLRHGDNDFYVDIGVYGTPKREEFEPVNTTRRVEQFLIRVGGFQMLYADTYLTESQFRKMFDHKLYDEIRQKLRCEKAFPEVYHKVCKSART